MIDWDRIQELTEEIGADDFAEVVGLFLSEVEEVLDRIQKRSHPNRLATDLHFLKGSAWNLGFKIFGDVCSLAEKLAAAGHGDRLEINEIARCYQSSKRSFFQTAGQLPGGAALSA